MDQPFLFMAGEYHVTMPLVFSRDHWCHTMTPKKLILDTNLHREGIAESLSGVIFYADMTDKLVEHHNLSLLSINQIPCWPNPTALLSMLDRHIVLKRCYDNGLVDHPIVQCIRHEFKDFPYPFVLKTNNSHRGEGKYLISNELDLPDWNGVATIEPYFEGESCRILLLGEHISGIKFHNDESWIKNSAGSDLEMWNSIPNRMISHAKSVRSLFNIEFAGVDYILDKDGFHFLEINQYPGVNVSDECASIAKQILSQKMDEIEQQVHFE